MDASAVQAMNQAMQRGSKYPDPVAPEDQGMGWAAAEAEGAAAAAAGALMQLRQPPNYAASLASPARPGTARPNTAGASTAGR